MKTKTSRKKVLAALAAALLLAGGCTSVPAPTASATEENRNMTSPKQTATPQQQTLQELFGNPDDWEMHFYAYDPLALVTRPITPEYFHAYKDTSDEIHYQHITDGKTVAAAIDALKDAEIAPEDLRVRDTRVLIEFIHKHRNEQIVLKGEGIVSILQAERKLDGETKENFLFGISWENFHALTQSHFKKSED